MILLIRVRPLSAAAAVRAASPLRLADDVREHGRTLVGVFGGTGLAGLGIAALAAWAPAACSHPRCCRT